MHLVKLKGGLGNQLFEYAFGRSLSEFQGVPVLFDNLSAFQSDSYGRSYGLTPFNVSLEVGYPERVDTGSFISRLRSLGCSPQYYLLREASLDFDATVLDVSQPSYFDGFWQSEQYFLESRDLLLRELTLKDPMRPLVQGVWDQISETPNAVSLHLRLKHGVLSSGKVNRIARQTHGQLNLEYYEAAIDCFKRQLGDFVLFVFSDDPVGSKAFLDGLDVAYEMVSSPDFLDYEDLVLMSAANHHIIANSSFSWWGAWLNPSDSKMVIAPSQWYCDSKKSIRDLIPSDWMVL